MADPGVVEPLLQALGDLDRWLREEDLQGIIIGGVAVAILGRPRMTRDVDALVLLGGRDEKELMDSAVGFGFVARVSDALAQARGRNVLLLRHQTSGIEVDVVLGFMPFEEEAVARSIRRSIGGVEVSLPTPEDLIIMKAVAGRPHDLRDIEGVLVSWPELDRDRILQWVKEYSEVLEAPEILQQLKDLLAATER